MAGFKPRTSGVGSDCSTNWAATIELTFANLWWMLLIKKLAIPGPFFAYFRSFPTKQYNLAVVVVKWSSCPPSTLMISRQAKILDGILQTVRTYMTCITLLIPLKARHLKLKFVTSHVKAFLLPRTAQFSNLKCVVPIFVMLFDCKLIVTYWNC